MLIRLNGETLELDAGCDVHTLLRARDCLHDGVAVAVNQCLLARVRWESTPLSENDEVDVFRVIAGG
ncbi:sulfur carrier protein ThiS [Paludibacterium yongneupense]|uniref:sulfur carrier protein ThiS n=1 Tax=Paludibacterium yongneupense TaxID=400061 RepID=UPI0003FBDD86|nr:sulfur carrier protein ThiS [Paludibacterium yongneupense]